ncbi:MAG: hypothetical protein EXR58_08680 [Chloroflexi bacterium]|nr:hypothetical protein [Chloroflexota bacterium]
MDAAFARELVARGIVLTHSVGTYDAPVAEYALGCMPDVAKHQRAFWEAQREHQWMRGRSWEDVDGHPLVPRLLRGQTLGIVGYGGIGRALERSARALGMRALGIRRSVLLSSSQPPSPRRLAA